MNDKEITLANKILIEISKLKAQANGIYIRSHNLHKKLIGSSWDNVKEEYEVPEGLLHDILYDIKIVSDNLINAEEYLADIDKETETKK